jgi:hypothetical protein
MISVTKENVTRCCYHSYQPCGECHRCPATDLALPASLTVALKAQLFLWISRSSLFLRTITNKALQRYLELIAVPSGSVGALKSCSVSVAKSDDVEIVNADESYAIDVKADRSCVISSQSIWGALRALESFTHVLVRNSAKNTEPCHLHQRCSSLRPQRYATCPWVPSRRSSK